MKLSGLPREQVPWYPKINEEKCTGCRICVSFCSHGTHEFDEIKGKARVARPFNCVIGCTGCEPKCPSGAISFPPPSVLSELRRVLKDRCGKGDCGAGEGCCR